MGTKYMSMRKRDVKVLGQRSARRLAGNLVKERDKEGNMSKGLAKYLGEGYGDILKKKKCTKSKCKRKKKK